MHAFDAEQFEPVAGAGEVADGIHRANFVEVDFVWRQAVDFSFGLGDPLEDGNGFLFHPRGELAARNDFLYFGKIPLLLVMMFLLRMVVVVLVRVVMRMIVVMRPMMVAVLVGMLMAVVRVREVDIKFHTGDGGFLSARNVQMPAVELELVQLTFEIFGVNAKVEQRRDEHVAGDAAENIKIQDFHLNLF